MEVVVALAILGIGLAALVELGSVTLRSTKKSEDYSMALLYARSYLEEAYATNTPSTGSETFTPEGASKLHKRDFRVVRDIEEKTIKEEAEEGVSVYEITVTVTWPPQGRLRLSGIRVLREGK